MKNKEIAKSNLRSMTTWMKKVNMVFATEGDITVHLGWGTEDSEEYHLYIGSFVDAVYNPESQYVWFFRDLPKEGILILKEGKVTTERELRELYNRVKRPK